METREKIRVEFPENASKEKIEFIRQELFNLLARHSCRIRRIDNE
tara:strand:- start:13782 stop:13916 length:135 start_codon:yes stop_codon:yes gene_type:complete